MIEVVGVRFKPAGKIYYFDPDGIELEVGNSVILETTRGIECGQVVVRPKMVTEEEIVAPLKKIIRKATDVDIKQVEINKAKEKEAFRTCLKKIEEHGLPMKLVDVEYTFDANKIIFYFTADGRIDFRELVKDLAAIFRTRIELRQIGVRDEAKMLGGLGTCGRGLCCASFLGEFDPVSIRMAKDQNLSLNPTKISGICGRLMCCLKYESDAYESEKALYPSEGTPVNTPVGEGKIISINILKKTLLVELRETRQMVEFPLHELQILSREKDNKEKKQRNNQTNEQQTSREMLPEVSDAVEVPEVTAD
ncbi:MAG: stage 0 sporulation family protein [Thermincola sp.]|jgi:cell fate regulator YaaT (PSP1 superfamily)|nr:stage 0 sporulation family protein [Thermincola sp.]MDT3702068.1 stage 0 sporulation family protein [Thermincola sp.]